MTARRTSLTQRFHIETHTECDLVFGAFWFGLISFGSLWLLSWIFLFFGPYPLGSSLSPRQCRHPDRYLWLQPNNVKDEIWFQRLLETIKVIESLLKFYIEHCILGLFVEM